MSLIYLTPASISYLAQFILSLAITLFLAHRLRNRTTQLVLLTCFFAGATVFIGLMFLDAALSPYPRLFAVYAENTVLALALVFLMQFAYRFPRLYACRKWEAHASLIASLAYLLWEAQFMIYRYVSLLQRETVYYRPQVSDYANALILLWVPTAFLRQCIAADPRPVNELLKLWKPQGKEARSVRPFVFVFAILAVLGMINLLRGYSLVSTMVYNMSMSIGILVTLWLFASSYINFIPGGVSILTRLSVLTSTLFLAMLGSVGWMLTPQYVDTYHPELVDHQTLRFSPNTSGGYDVALVDFRFETGLGDRLQVQPTNEARNQKIDFTFPFYGHSYTEIYVASSGVIGMGSPFWQPNMQARRANLPAIFPLMIDLDPNAGGGLYACQGPNRLILTWDHLPALYRPEAVFTFQAVLYRDGVFDITTNGLPLPFRFDPDETPSANPWVRGVTPGRGECLHTSTDTLSGPRQRDQRAIVQNYQLDFRRYLHAFILPLEWVVIGGSLLLLVALPLLLHFSLVRPLDRLAAGVRQMEASDLSGQVLVQNEDEIGFLTNAFNTMASRLGELVTGLEERVSERTMANEHLRAEIDAREQAQILEQQRVLATLDERARLNCEWHDGLGQVLGYITVQAEAIRTLLEKEQVASARVNLRRLAQAAHEANADLRNHLLGLRAPGEAESPSITAPPKTLLDALPVYLEQFQVRHGVEVRFWPPESLSDVLFPPSVEEQVTRIIQEALTNVARHAQARQVDVEFQLVDDQVQITITDDGVGFEPPDWRSVAAGTSRSGHYGLTIMRERAEQVGGRLEIRTAPGQGTRVIATLPRLLPRTEGEEVEIKGLRVVLADDCPLFLDGLRNLLVARGVTVVGTAHDGLQAIEKVRALRPDVAVLDLNMPGCNGVEATRAIKAEMPEVQVVILTVPESEDHLYEVIKSGASGYLYKDLEANLFCRLLAGLLHDEAALGPGIAERLMAEFARATSTPDGGDDLTPRQWEVLGLVARGLTYKEIGQRLHLSEKTIKYHMAQIVEKLHIENRAHAIAYYVQKTQE